jgi:hypothetical protein
MPRDFLGSDMTVSFDTPKNNILKNYRTPALNDGLKKLSEQRKVCISIQKLRLKHLSD